MENVLNISKILLAQINTISCNVEFNKNRAIEVIKQGIENNCEMVVFPKNFLVSNDIGNVLERFNFISNQVKIAVEELVQYSSKVAILIGAINDEFYFLNEQEKIKIDNNSNNIFDFKNVKFQILSSYEEKKRKR
jgi:predicted amidohydrolase